MVVDGQRDASATLPPQLVLTGAENLAPYWDSVPRMSSPRKVIILSTLCQQLHIQSPEHPAHRKSLYCPHYSSNSTFSPQNVQPTESHYTVHAMPATPHSVPRMSSPQKVIIPSTLCQQLHIQSPECPAHSKSLY
jgi:hypothetical protein